MADLGKHYDVAIIDECQMIADESRAAPGLPRFLDFVLKKYISVWRQMLKIS